MVQCFIAKIAYFSHAFPVEKLKDPTGAGDSFAGGLMGALAQSKKPVMKISEMQW